LVRPQLFEPLRSCAPADSPSTERKKAERRLKKAQKALAATEDEAEKARLQEQERVLNIDIAYTQYHPHLEPYVSLYPNNINDGKKNKKQEEQDDDEAEENPDDPMNKPDMWHVIEEAMKEGTAALEKIRDRKNAAAFLQAPLVINSRPKEESAAERKQDRGPPREKGRKKDVHRSGHWQEATGPEEEDDGEGFFE
jgi:flagellar biosynthesis chaperone FliJ